MSNPIQPINSVIRAFRKLVPEGQKVLIACSGGADSMALLFCAQKAKIPIEVCHVLHDMRPYDESAKDRDLVMQYCEKNNIPFTFELALCSLTSNENRENLENRYRDLRGHLIERVAFDSEIQYIATGHHADDQLETMLMKICRGTGLRGLVGIFETYAKTSDITYVRPMLGITKAEAYAICNENEVPFSEDATNKDTDYTRNAIRHKILPILKELFPNCSQKANGLSEITTSVNKVLSNTVDLLGRHAIDIGEEWGLAIKIEALRLEEDVIIHEWLRKAISVASAPEGQAHFDSINKTMINDVICAIRDHQSRKFVWPNNLLVQVNQTSVKVYYADPVVAIPVEKALNA